MFKYTPPWQVLCNSMEHEPKKQSEPTSDDLQDAFLTTQEDDVVLIQSDRHPTQAPLSAQADSLHTAPMESMPKKWVMQPLSPKLELTDLRNLLSPGTEQTGADITVVRSQPSVTVTSTFQDSLQDVFVQANQVAVSNESSSGEDWHASSPSSPSSPSCPSSPSSSGSHSGFYSFVERDLSPEAEKTEAWMSSPEREAKLSVLKEENGYKLRAYMEDKRPDKLFEETNGDSRYRIEEGDTVQEEQEQIQERLEIIHSQAYKFNPVFKKQRSALESLDLSYSQKQLEGFSLTYSSPRMEAQQTEAGPGTVDTQQISFITARQQFMKMEQTRNPFLQSPHQLLQFPKHQERPLRSEVIVPSNKVHEDDLPDEQLSQSPKSDPVEDKVFTRRMVTVSITEESGTRRQSSSFDDLDSGLGDFSLDPRSGYASDGSASSEALGAGTGDEVSTTSTRETPIEREIRVAQEREESLRRERGIKRTDVNEMVEIKTKPLLSQAGPSLTPVKTKERNRVSFLIQRDIEKDSRREEDLQHQGRVPGLYDRGTAQELEERKRFFELQEDQIPVMPTKRSLMGNLLVAKQASPDPEEGRETPDAVELIEQISSPGSENMLSCCPHRHPDKTVLRIASLEYSTESPASQERIPEAIQVLPHSIPADKVSIEDGERYTPSQITSFNYSPSFLADKRLNSARGYFSSKDVPSPSSDTPSASPSLQPALFDQPTPHWHEHYKQFNLKPRRTHTPDAIRKEIEWEMKREDELRSLREARRLSLSSDGGLASLDQAPPADPVGPAPIKPAEEDGTSLLQGLKEEAVGHERPIPSVLLEERITRSGPRPSSLWVTDTVNCQETPSILTPDKAWMKVSTPPCPSPHLAMRLPSVTMMTAQPWGTPRQAAPLPALSRPLTLMPQSAQLEAGGAATQKGLTETLLEDFEERRIKLKLEENSYAGIHPCDDVNNEVLEATRVTRHKNTQALRWEAGVYANEGGN